MAVSPTSDSIRVCITLGTRPETIKLAPVIQTFQQLPQFETTVVLTGQHREMVAQVMSLFNLTADHNLDIMQPKQTLRDITCRSLQGLEKLFVSLRPDIVISQGDTTTAFPAALAAFYQKIPVGHVEAGLRSRDRSMPEEINRLLTDEITDLCFITEQSGMDNLLKDGKNPSASSPP